MFTLALSTMSSLFICILIGFYAAKRNILEEDAIDKLNIFLLNVTFPFMMVSIFNIQLTDQILKLTMPIFIYGVLYQLILAIIGIIFLKLCSFEENKSKVILFSMIFTNTGFLGLPLVAALFDSQGLLYASLLNIPFNITCFSFGVYILQPSDENHIKAKDILLKPAMIGIWIGCFLMFSQLIIPGTYIVNDKVVRLPAFLTNTINMVGSITSPLAMIIVGASLKQTKFKRVFCDYKLHLFSLIKLIIAPIIIYILGSLFITNSQILIIVALFSGLPSATLGTILAERFGHDYVYASEIVFISTLYSLFTIPLLFTIFNI